MCQGSTHLVQVLQQVPLWTILAGELQLKGLLSIFPDVP